jgi:hypothetical protein
MIVNIDRVYLMAEDHTYDLTDAQKKIIRGLNKKKAKVKLKEWFKEADCHRINSLLWECSH